MYRVMPAHQLQTKGYNIFFDDTDQTGMEMLSI